MYLSADVDDFISGLVKPEQVLMRKLRKLIVECLPYATEKHNYGAPFYVHHRMICFIWPQSLGWGPKRKSGESFMVALGFCQGNKMANEQGLLHADGRKQVYCMYFNSLSEIDEAQVRALLYEASIIDEEFGRQRKKGNRR